MSPVRILYIHQHFKFPDEPGGSRPYEFARRLAADGHDVTVLMGYPQDETLCRDGIRAVRVGAKYGNHMHNMARMWSFAAFMAKSTRFAARHSCDVVFASSTPLTVAVPGMVSQICNRARFVFEVRDVWPKVPIDLGELKNPVVIALAKALERITYRRADHVIALSPGMATDVLTVAPNTVLSMIPNAADLELFRHGVPDKVAARVTLGWAIEEHHLSFVGSLGRSYDIPWLVHLASVLGASGIRVRIFGEGSALDSGRKLAASLGMDPLSVLPGPVPKSEVPVIMAASDATISSLIDNRALEVNSLNKVFDSLAARRPVFFNHGGWLEELAIAGGAGWRVTRDVQAAADQIGNTLEASVLSDASEAAKRLADEHFSRNALYAQFRAAIVGSDGSE